MSNMVGFFSPVHYIENNSDFRSPKIDWMASTCINFGQQTYMVVNPRTGDSKKIPVCELIFNPSQTDLIKDQALGITLYGKCLRVLLAGTILTLSIITNPLFLIIPTVILVAQAIFRLSNKRFEIVPGIDEDLNNWQNDEKVSGNKEEAVRRIKVAFYNNLTSLDLEGLELTKLPSCLNKLSNLRKLNLDDNNFVSRSRSMEILYQRIEDNLFEDNLNDWENQLTGNSSIVLKHKKAAKQIREAYYTKQVSLPLGFSELFDLPTCLGKLKGLEHLGLSHNQLTDLPVEITNLSKLVMIELQGNQFTSVPEGICTLLDLEYLCLGFNEVKYVSPKIGQLINLIDLDLSYNKIKTLPVEIGQLFNLEHLDLSGNKIKTLPVEIGQLFNLEHLDLSGNKDLEELPIILGQLPMLQNIIITGTQIPPSNRDSILLSCRALRNKGGQQGLQGRLTLWKGLGHCEVDLKEFEKLTTSEANTLNEWLLRLQRTRDFKGYQKDLIGLVWDILKSLNVNSEFKEIFFVLAEVNNEDCEDRAAMALNEIYTAWMIQTSSKEKMTFKEQLLLMTRVAKTLALRRLIGQKIAEHQLKHKNIEKESVEIYLYYETTLRERLNLLTAIKRMTYVAVGVRGWIKSENLVEEVNKSYLDDLIDLPLFMKLVKEREDLKKSWSDCDEKFSEKMSVLDEEKPETDELSEKMLEWEIKMNKLKEEQTKEKNMITKNWIKNF